MTSSVKAKRPSDFLIALPRVMGYTPVNSIVVQTFQSRQTAASLRVDLPTAEHQKNPRLIADAIIRLISRVPGVDAVLIAIYTDEAWSAADRPPRPQLVEAIVTRMASAGLGIVDALCCSGRSWASYLDAERGTFDENEKSRIEAELDGVGAPRDVEAIAQGAPPICEGPSAQRDGVAQASTAIMHDARERERLWEWPVAHVLWTDAIESTPTDLPPKAVAALLWSIRDKGVRDCVLMLMAWGNDAGDRAAADTALLRRGLTVPDGSILETFVGEGRQCPDGLRIEGAVRLLRHLISLAPRPWQLAPFTMLAWFEWARGQGSAAGDYLEQALSIGPGYELARLFEQLISTGRVPDWVGRQAV
ncbi:DUF4192 domain-containing protein [Agreia pratensis]|uniref:DUF4192 domain-containing protein n=1 Tax=Agreia pratensis TaxID=150121 RepID=UPI00188BB636|nr:DUF4192 domain-containing protein [Agreia pratensis]MBF4634367.1 DUF4192 domain-containing protein [Agreia pratensis]